MEKIMFLRLSLVMTDVGVVEGHFVFLTTTRY